MFHLHYMHSNGDRLNHLTIIYWVRKGQLLIVHVTSTDSIWMHSLTTNFAYEFCIDADFHVIIQLQLCGKLFLEGTWAGWGELCILPSSIIIPGGYSESCIVCPFYCSDIFNMSKSLYHILWHSHRKG